jgi:hypothetical protein
MLPIQNVALFTDILKTEAAGPSETLVALYKTTQSHNPDDCNMKYQQHENLKSHITKIPSTAANVSFFTLTNSANLWQNLNWKPFKSLLFFFCMNILDD